MNLDRPAEHANAKPVAGIPVENPLFVEYPPVALDGGLPRNAIDEVLLQVQDARQFVFGQRFAEEGQRQLELILQRPSIEPVVVAPARQQLAILRDTDAAERNHALQVALPPAPRALVGRGREALLVAPDQLAVIRGHARGGRDQVSPSA